MRGLGTAGEADRLIASWPRGSHSEHIRLEIVNAIHVGHTPGSAPPLGEGAPVPGCACPHCTGVPQEHPARRQPRRRQRGGRRQPCADCASITDVATMLGLGAGRRSGDELAVCCPLHDDKEPSMFLNEEKSVWYCFGCGEGGDAIRLVERLLGCSFTEAVHMLTKR